MAERLKSMSVKIPDKIARNFKPIDLMECGVPIRHGCATLVYKLSGDGKMTLARKHEPMSYLGRFETEMDDHYRATTLSSSNTTAGQGAKEDWDAPVKQTQKDKNAPGMEAPQVSTEGPKQPPRDEETHEQFMSRLRAERNVPPRPMPKKKQDVFPTPPMKPAVHAAPKASQWPSSSKAVASF